ncbi:MAG: bifunctional shikimate kinase/3-dehydroquinate synthase [Deltaproteobacteria bacterium]|nr:bifunctional shikimate kinase/3-dehydroquinate synthase [Deltaproteobacteria bacterium]
MQAVRAQASEGRWIAPRPRIVLSGPPGVGKSALAERLASRLGVPFRDLDVHLAKGRARSAGALLELVGETEFRRLEAETLASLSIEPGVLALGGGTLTTIDGRRAARRHGVLVGLEASVSTLELRADPSDRPVLRQVGLESLLAQRSHTLGFVDLSMSAEGSLDEVVDRLEARLSSLAFIDVSVDAVTSRVIIGSGLDTAIQAAIRDHEPRRTVLAVIDRGIPQARRVALQKSLEAVHPTHFVELEGGERVKSFATLGELLEAATQAGCGRQSVVIGIGGGAVLDLTAMAASLLGRGAPLVLVPTTLVAQIDASIGGKTAVDLRSGKNLAGTFHPATDVIVDPSFLKSLAPVDLRSGLAELVKIAIVADRPLFEALVDDHAIDSIERWIAPAISAKARIVAADPYDRGIRRTLNFGHTFGHAFESATGCSHGEAVAIGMAAEVRLGRDRGWTPASDANRILGTLEELGLPVCSSLSENCLSFLRADKKAEHETLELAVIEAIGQVSMRREAFQDLAPALVRCGDCR